MTYNSDSPEAILNSKRTALLLCIGIFHSILFRVFFKDLKDYEEKIRDIEPGNSHPYAHIKELMDHYRKEAREAGIDMSSFDSIFMNENMVYSSIDGLTRKK